MTDTTHDDLVKRICEEWVKDGRSEDCFWEGWPECPTPEDSLTPRMVIDRITALTAERDEWRKAYHKTHDLYASSEERADALAERLAKAVEAGHALNDALREKERGKYLTTAQVLAAEKARAPSQQSRRHPMTDTTHEAPERIWVQTDHIPDQCALDKWHVPPEANEACLFTEYTRADLVQAAVAGVLRAAAADVSAVSMDGDYLAERILALITPDAQAALDRAVAAERERCAKVAGDAWMDGVPIAEIPAIIRKGGE
jgi:hypothetical protein